MIHQRIITLIILTSTVILIDAANDRLKDATLILTKVGDVAGWHYMQPSRTKPHEKKHYVYTWNAKEKKAICVEKIVETPTMLFPRTIRVHPAQYYSIEILPPRISNAKKADREQFLRNIDQDFWFAAAYGDISGLQVAEDSVDINVNCFNENKHKNTPLMMAAKGGHVQVVKYLLATHKVNLFQKNLNKKTAFDLAKTDEIANLLQEASQEEVYAPDFSHDKVIEEIMKTGDLRFAAELPSKKPTTQVKSGPVIPIRERIILGYKCMAGYEKLKGHYEPDKNLLEKRVAKFSAIKAEEAARKALKS